MSFMAEPDSAAPAADVTPPAGAPTTDTVADGIEHRLDPRIITLERVTGWITTAFLGFVLLVVLLINLGAGGFSGATIVALAVLWWVVMGPLIWRAHFWPPIRYRHASYTVDDLGIEIREGVFWQAVVNVPRTRVQHTDVSQGPLERKFGLGTLVIYTAGTDHSRVSLPGLEHARAMRIREHLLPGGASDAV